MLFVSCSDGCQRCACEAPARRLYGNVVWEPRQDIVVGNSFTGDTDEDVENCAALFQRKSCEGSFVSVCTWPARLEWLCCRLRAPLPIDKSWCTLRGTCHNCASPEGARSSELGHDMHTSTSSSPRQLAFVRPCSCVVFAFARHEEQNRSERRRDHRGLSTLLALRCLPSYVCMTLFASTIIRMHATLCRADT